MSAQSRRTEDSSHSSDFFSPISISFFQGKEKSWIGARLSPIKSFDNDIDMESSERTSLLNRGSKIHPLWNSPPATNQRSFRKRRLQFSYIVCTMSVLHMFCMGVYDVFETYRLYRLGSNDASLHVWSLPYLIPPKDTLLLFGSLSPNYFALQSRYVVSPLIASFSATSLVELLVCLSSWKLLGISNRRAEEKKNDTPRYFQNDELYNIFAVYVASVLTGILYLWVYDDPYTLTGCFSWGTIGVLCCIGMARPLHRFELFVMASIVLIVSLLTRPYNSVWGCNGGAFLGWALGALQSPNKYVNLLGTGLAVFVVSFPVLNLFFLGTFVYSSA